MAIVFEFGVAEGSIFFACKVGQAGSDLRKVNLVAIPGGLVALLATVQVLTMLLALTYFLGKWLRGRKKDAGAASLEEPKPGSSSMTQATAEPLDPLSATWAINMQSSSRLFSLPGELRMVIYRKLLVTKNDDKEICGLADLLNAKLRPNLTTHSGSFDTFHVKARTDAALIRTCHRIYAEALPTLYGQNTFSFNTGPSIERFRALGLNLSLRTNELGHCMPIFGLQPRCQGRLSLIRHLKLIFDDFPKAWDDVEDQGKRTREQGWSEFLQQNRFTHGIGNVCFEYLETLELDFSEWGAIRREDLTVRPFIERFRTAQGLSKLAIAGIRNKDTLLALKQGLLKQGGQFEAYRDSKKLVFVDWKLEFGV